MWVLDQWRYFAHIMIVCISSRKAGKDAMGHDLAAAMVGLSLNRGYNFSRYIFKAINDQINTAERFRFLLYPRFVQLLIDDALPNLRAIGERLQVKRVDKRVFAQFLKPGSVEPTPEHTELFGHLINEAYVAPEDWNWYSPNSGPEMSDHSDEEQDEGDDEHEGDDEGGAEESDSEATESDSSDSDDAPSQAHPRRSAQVTLPESSSKRKRQSSSSEYEPASDSDAALQRRRREKANKKRGDRQEIDALLNLEEGEIDSGDDWNEDDDDVVIDIPKGDGEGEYELEDGEIFEVPSLESLLDTGSVDMASNVEATTEASPVDPIPADPEAQKEKDMPSASTKGPATVWQKTSITDKHGATCMILAVRYEEDKQLFTIKRSGGVQYLKPTSEAFNSLPKYDLVNLANHDLLSHSNNAVAMGLWVTLQREARQGNFEYLKPQVPRRVKDKHVVHPVTKKPIKRLVYKPVRCETKIPLSKLPQDILGDMWYWYVDPKTGEAVVMSKGKSESGNMVPKEVIGIFDEVCFINFSVNDLEVLADKYCIHIDEWTKLLSAKYDKLIKFCLDYKKKMEAKEQTL
ncbi:hypothetical protein L1987_37569 [Smallanthus sonchifolius]|uniref:Uncharacterized protein n=1 Tax=Smallanthus sonchifolius TaxID=185202 RepID=A0ACB9HHY9_9ASTR|nr:hypothetical protein L1987_37569 [Smallanthus sonchifolius]